LLCEIIKDLKNCAPVKQQVPDQTYQFIKSVASYGTFLDGTDLKDYNRLTIYNPDYWNAFFSLTANDATVLFTRLLFPMREGLLEQSEIV
jgi:hypothetical protein